jgi:NADH:ubiquinone oxidoreductase subunit F (NADH-binding)
VQRLLAGPPPELGAESLVDHVARLGRLPSAAEWGDFPAVLEASGLLGRGGAAFPVGRKWASVAGRSNGSAVVLANGAEGEPLSAKDRTLMARRPHLVIDGAELAAEVVRADRIVLYVGAEHRSARSALVAALRERSARRGFDRRVPVSIVAAPPRYVAGEESAAVHFVNDADARPTTTPPRPFERGVGGRPTLVQNVESLAQAALIARRGDAWYREAGEGSTRGTALVTVDGAARNGVLEIPIGTTVERLAAASGAPDDDGAVLLGGYFGGWLARREVGALALDPIALRAAGSAFGCGVVAFLPESRCGVRATARIIDYMAGQSAAQCGPCVFGLRAIADTTVRLAHGWPERDDLERLSRWTGQLAGRGACRHPDGAAGLMASALRVFADDFGHHQRTGRCRIEAADGRAA